MTNQQFRQGDILLIRIAKAPTKLTSVEAEGGRLIVARGEATGHHHSFPHQRGATLFRDDGGGGGLMVKVDAPAVPWEHQEHATINVPEGTYRVVRQREYSPEAIRQVAD